MKLPREFCIPKGFVFVRNKQSDAVAYVYTTAKGKFGSKFGAALPEWRVRATRDLLGYVYAHSNHEAWVKARLKYGMMMVQTVEMV